MKNEKEEKGMEENQIKGKPNRNRKVLLIGLGLVIIISLIVIYFVFGKDKGFKYIAYDMFETEETSFFIESKEEKYAAFSKSGKQLTDFIYDEYTYFDKGAAYVGKDDKHGLISEDGKMLVELGAYDEFSNLSGNNLIFYASAKDNYLVNYEGKRIYKEKDFDIVTPDNSNYYYLENDDEYRVLSISGKLLLTLKKNHNAEEPTLNYFGNAFYGYYLVVTYNNKVYFYNLDEDKEIITYEFKDDDISYFSVGSISITKDKYILAGYDKEGSIIRSLVIENNKVTKNIKDEYCSIVGFDKDGSVACQNKDDEAYYILNDKGKMIEPSLLDSQVIDTENYAHEVSDKDGKKSVEIYYKGKLVNTIKCASIGEINGKLKNDAYYISNLDSDTCTESNNKFTFYKLNGKKLFDEEYYSITYFDDNGLSIVETEGNKSILINYKGKKLSKEYETLEWYGDYYLGTNSNEDDILNRKGKVLLSAKNINLIAAQGKRLATSKKDNETTFYDLKTMKELYTIKGNVTPSYYYIEALSDNGASSYYSYETGKKIYQYSEGYDYDTSAMTKVNIEGAEKLYKKEGISLLYIGRATCEFCRNLVPNLNQVQKDLNINIYYLDSNSIEDSNLDNLVGLMDYSVVSNGIEGTIGELFKEYGFTPTVAIIKDGKTVDGFIGTESVDSIKNRLSELEKSTD